MAEIGHRVRLSVEPGGSAVRWYALRHFDAGVFARLAEYGLDYDAEPFRPEAYPGTHLTAIVLAALLAGDAPGGGPWTPEAVMALVPDSDMSSLAEECAAAVSESARQLRRLKSYPKATLWRARRTAN